MEGHGVYRENSQVQAAGLSPAVALFEEAARIVDVPALPQPIVIADYGSADGRNSLGPIGAAVGALRQRLGIDREISVVHTDLPENDFASLFALLATDSASYLRDDPAIFASAIGRSFYQQLLPSGSVTLGWSSWSVQWLSRIPCAIPDQLGIAFSNDAAARAAFAAQAARDWETFLTARAQELRSGGRLAIVTMACDENGKFGYDAQMAAMYAALLELVDNGLVSRDESAKMTIPTVGRSLAELLLPFEQNDGTFAGLRVERADMFAGDDRLWHDYCRDGDARQFGARWAAFSRASVFPTLATALAGGSADPRASAFVEAMEKGLAQRLAGDPQPTNIPLARMLIGKQ